MSCLYLFSQTMYTYGSLFYYCPQTKFAKVMFYRCLSFCPQGGAVRGCSRGGGMCGCLGGMRGCSRGACVVAPGGACMVAPGGVHGCSRGPAWLLQGACVVALGGRGWFFDEIRSMRGRYASYWNAYLLKYRFHS